jgi:simple sugar transport system permease protein
MTVDPIIDVLYALPVIGLLFQLVGYLVAVLPDIAPIVLRSATPLALGALCGVICERSGVVNIGIEGTMLASAFTGWAVGVAVAPVLGTGPSTAPFGATPALVVSLAAALFVALLISLLHAWLSITVRADQIISGTIINIAAFGLTGYLNTLIATSSPTGAGSFALFTPPRALTDLPLVGWIFAMVLDQGPIAMSVILWIALFQVLLFRSRWGLRTRAVGEHPKAAETVGIDVIRLRYQNVLVGGLFAGLAGAYLSMEATNSFQAGMTTGRGFIALAAMIVGRWTPLGAFGAALLFASSQAIGQSITFAAPGGELGRILTALPGQFYDALPYVVTIVVLAGVVGRSIPPAADGQPYEREAAT